MKSSSSTPPPLKNCRRSLTSVASFPPSLLFLAFLLVSFVLLIAPRAQAQRTVWSATLSPRTITGGNLIGCAESNAGTRCTDSLSPSRSFTHEGTGYNVEAIILSTIAGVSNLTFTLDKSIPQGLTLHVGSSSFTIASATPSDGGKIATWNNPGLSWSVGTTVSLRLTDPSAAPPPPPPPPPPVIESPEGVSHSGNASDGFSLTPLGEGGSIVYRKRTIDIPVTRDECTSPGNPALIISRSTLDRVREITFELSEVSPQDPPSGFRMEGCVAEIDPGIRLGQRETVAVCLPPAEVKGEAYVHRYDGEWEILPSRSETVNGEELVCGDTDSFSLFGVFLPVIESAEGVTHSEDSDSGFFPYSPQRGRKHCLWGENYRSFSYRGCGFFRISRSDSVPRCS